MLVFRLDVWSGPLHRRGSWIAPQQLKYRCPGLTNHLHDPRNSVTLRQRGYERDVGFDVRKIRDELSRVLASWRHAFAVK